VALCVSGAIDETSTNKVKQFRKGFTALSSSVEPSMQLKEDLNVWAGAGKFHTDWEAGFGLFSNQLTVLGDPLPLKESDQIVIKNVKNPYLSGIKTILILEADQDLPIAERAYTHVKFRKQAMVLANSDKLFNLWGTTQSAVVL
jgi:hypothetical protein